MSEQQTDTTRTPNPNDAETGAQTPNSETPGTGERTDPSGEYQRQQALANKVAAEKLNRLMEHHGVTTPEELEEVLAQPPAAREAPRAREGRDDDDALSPADLVAVEEWAQNKDPLARLVTKLVKRVERAEQRAEQLEVGTVNAFEARDIADPKERARVVAYFQKNRHRLGDLRAARAELEAPSLRQRLAAAEAENARLKKGPDPDVIAAPRMPGPDSSPPPQTVKRKMTEAQYDAELASLPTKDRMKLQRDYREGNVVLGG